MFVDSFKFFKRKDSDLALVIDPDSARTEVRLAEVPNYEGGPNFIVLLSRES